MCSTGDVGGLPVVDLADAVASDPRDPGDLHKGEPGLTLARVTECLPGLVGRDAIELVDEPVLLLSQAAPVRCLPFGLDGPAFVATASALVAPARTVGGAGHSSSESTSPAAPDCARARLRQAVPNRLSTSGLAADTATL